MNQSAKASSKNLRKSRIRPTIQTTLRPKGLEMDRFYTIREGDTSAVAWKLPSFQIPTGAGRHATHLRPQQANLAK